MPNALEIAMVIYPLKMPLQAVLASCPLAVVTLTLLLAHRPLWGSLMGCPLVCPSALVV